MTDTTTGPPRTGLRSLPDILRMRAGQQPHQTAYTFLHNGEGEADTLTYRELDAGARGRAAALAPRLGGHSAVLLYPAGLEFVRTLLGCMYAGVAGAPVQVPNRVRGLQRMRRIADDAGATTILTTTSVKRDLEERFGDRPELSGLTVIDTASLPPAPEGDWTGNEPRLEDIALLQYTSGSTGDPKGVMVRHDNLVHNAAETDELWPCAPDGTVVSWLPLFHDMGLLFGVVLPLWAGIPAYLMAPDAFIRRPARWLEAVSRFRGTHAAAPSFAYELCVRAAAEGAVPPGLDLTSWRIAANGAEPVRSATVRAFIETFSPMGFSATAMCPGYGLAENTLKATGSPQGQAPGVLRLSAEELAEDRVRVVAEDAGDAVPLVSCGAPARGTRVRIVDPVTRTVCPPDRTGEIWINGPCVAAGYHGRPVETEETFRARLAGSEDEGTEPHLRTGDLGFVHEGELYVTGRLKDVIIRKGRNFYPQDIELSAESAHAGLRPNCAAAFSVDDGESERLVVAVETDGRVLRSVGAGELRQDIREQIWDGQRLQVDDVVLIRRGALPRTSSGKVQRRACRQRYLDDELRGTATGEEG
ncbi:fatty acyl-AMP ligase [Streptomyces sulphureus]|uniref:fatty acyl-AMP ligase n=1 Tax=Streptomyces sulphureus TaxID=47758 RepID=UPI00035EAD5C|nr:fatty acyl-AMP ligase [Streptomyces sulphureus]